MQVRHEDELRLASEFREQLSQIERRAHGLNSD